jgi:hypothetical protein
MRNDIGKRNARIEKPITSISNEQKKEKLTAQN